jgi:large subunit ribosomal protein L24
MPGVDIKKDDTVRVISGKDRGREGRVVRVLPREGRVMVDGVALAKKHQRSTGRRARGSSQQLYQSGGIIDAEMFVNISNVQVVCTACGKATRLGHRVEGDRKVRFCRKCETELP